MNSIKNLWPSPNFGFWSFI